MGFAEEHVSGTNSQSQRNRSRNRFSLMRNRSSLISENATVWLSSHPTVHPYPQPPSPIPLPPTLPPYTLLPTPYALHQSTKSRLYNLKDVVLERVAFNEIYHAI